MGSMASWHVQYYACKQQQQLLTDSGYPHLRAIQEISAELLAGMLPDICQGQPALAQGQD